MDRIDLKIWKDRIDLVRVVSHYLSLEKRGKAYLGLCPFHADHHPSLQVDPGKGVYHCFSCGAGGDALRFVQEKEGCGFGEAVCICAEICHLPVPTRGEVSRKAIPAAPPVMAEKGPEPTVEENECFLRSLLPYDPGMEELCETYASFKVGMAPGSVPGTYAFTRNRLVFPIQDAGGHTVAFAARYRGTPVSKKIPKYLNSETSSIYKKDELLYGWFQALATVRETGILFITEGYKDTLAMHAAGFTQTVALCGTNLSVHHLAMIRKEVVTVCLFLDADEAGRKTAVEVMPKLRKAGLVVVDVVPEGGKDPDEMFRNAGRERFIAWVRQQMIPPARRHTGALLVAACHRWPDTRCLMENGEQKLYVENITEVLEYDDLLPGEPLFSSSDTGSTEDFADLEELDRQYELHTDSTHSCTVRRSELIRYLFLCYLEACFTDRIRHTRRNLSRTVADDQKQMQLLSDLHYQRNYLCRVSRELGRRG